MWYPQPTSLPRNPPASRGVVNVMPFSWKIKRLSTWGDLFLPRQRRNCCLPMPTAMLARSSSASRGVTWRHSSASDKKVTRAQLLTQLERRWWWGRVVGWWQQKDKRRCISLWSSPNGRKRRVHTSHFFVGLNTSGVIKRAAIVLVADKPGLSESLFPRKTLSDRDCQQMTPPC